MPPKAGQLNSHSPAVPAHSPESPKQTIMARARAGLRAQGPPVGGGLRQDPARGQGHVTSGPAPPGALSGRGRGQSGRAGGGGSDGGRASLRAATWRRGRRPAAEVALALGLECLCFGSRRSRQRAREGRREEEEESAGARAPGGGGGGGGRERGREAERRGGDGARRGRHRGAIPAPSV